MNAIARRPLDMLTQRQLTPDDLQAMFALHQRSIHGLGIDVVNSETPDFMGQLLKEWAQVTGIFEHKTLIAYGVLQHQLTPEIALPHSIALDATRQQLKLAGASVAPEWRGHGLQRQLVKQRIALASAQALLFSTAAPANPYSWNNLLSCGFHIRGLIQMYGGFSRYLLVRDQAIAQKPLYSEQQEVQALDLKTQQQLLEQGWSGILPGHTLRHVLYAKPRADLT